MLLALNILFIWGNSLMPGAVSGAISGWVRDVLAGIFPGGSQDPDAGHGLLRKLAHFTEFACLGILLTWLYGMLRKPVWLAILCGFLVASADETIQCFVPDRGPSIWDVMIDASGVLLGVVLLLVGHKIFSWRKFDEKNNCVAVGSGSGFVHCSLRQKIRQCFFFGRHDGRKCK